MKNSSKLNLNGQMTECQIRGETKPFEPMPFLEEEEVHTLKMSRTSRG